MKRSTQESRLYLADIAEAAGKIGKYTKGISSLAEFKRSGPIEDAVIRNLEIIGEAVKNLPQDIKAKRGDVDWKKIAGLRDILAHAYFGVDFGIIWDVVENKVPALKEAVDELLKDF
jgi:uncharacterized protein with HEPN domain